MNALAMLLVICSISIAGAPLLADNSMGSSVSSDHRTMRCCTMQVTPVTDNCQKTDKTHCTCNTSLPKSSCSGCCTGMIAQDSRIQTLFNRIRRYMVSGYRRISGKTLLDHETRYLLYEFIVEVPGIDLKTLAECTGLNGNTIRYHLQQMENAGKIRVIFEAGCLHFFENHGKYSEHEQKLLSVRFTSHGSRILNSITDSPGLTRGELATLLGVSGPSVTRSMQRLITNGLVLQMKDGRYTRYYLAESPVHPPSLRVSSQA